MSDPPRALATSSLNYTRTDSVALPQSDAEKRFAIRMSDWERLKRQMSKCGDDYGLNLSGWYFCSFGIAGSAFLSIIPLSLSKEVPYWVVPLYVCVGIFSALLGGALLHVSRRAARERKSRLEEIGIDMGEIERGFQST